MACPPQQSGGPRCVPAYLPGVCVSVDCGRDRWGYTRGGGLALSLHWRPGAAPAHRCFCVSGSHLEAVLVLSRPHMPRPTAPAPVTDGRRASSLRASPGDRCTVFSPSACAPLQPRARVVTDLSGSAGAPLCWSSGGLSVSLRKWLFYMICHGTCSNKSFYHVATSWRRCLGLVSHW